MYQRRFPKLFSRSLVGSRPFRLGVYNHMVGPFKKIIWWVDNMAAQFSLKKEITWQGNQWKRLADVDQS